MGQFSTIQTFAIWVLPVLFAITVHEVAHGWIANKLGDPTAKILGRLTLNPIKHIDPIGTILVPVILFYLGGFIFGWARPVPVNFRNLRKPRRDMALVALAGPMSNLVMAILWALIAKLGVILFKMGLPGAVGIAFMGQAGIIINLILLVLNLIPIPPLDGGRILSALLPVNIAEKFNRIEPYGFFILLFLLAVGIFGNIIGPPVAILHYIIVKVIGL